MKTGGGKAKGGRFEREVCRQLSLWISDNKREDVFWRSAMSGGRATVALKRRVKLGAHAGDVSATAALGESLLNHFYIECKTYANLGLIQSLTKRTGNLYKFWSETRRQAIIYSKRPILIARQNAMPTLCLIDSTALMKFCLADAHCLARFIEWNCYVMLFDSFLEYARVPDAKAQPPARRERVRLRA